MESRELSQVLQSLNSQISSFCWPSSKQASLVLSYLIAKAKSMVHVEVLWRPIAAAPKPLISKSIWRVAARAFTRFVSTLVDEIPAGFLTCSLQGVGTWVKLLLKWGATRIEEADCKVRFIVIPPAAIVEHMKEAQPGSRHARDGGLPL